MKMHQVKPKKMDMMAMPGKPKPHRPSIHLGFDALPEGKDWEVGKKYRIVLEVEQIGKHIDEHDDKKNGGAEFAIHAAGGEIMNSKVRRHAES